MTHDGPTWSVWVLLEDSDEHPYWFEAFRHLDHDEAWREVERIEADPGTWAVNQGKDYRPTDRRNATLVVLPGGVRPVGVPEEL